MRQTATLLCAAPLAALLLLSSAAFSVSGGVGPNEFNKGDEFFVKVNELTSIKTQIPNSYYSLPFCKPDDGVVDGAPGLWEVLSGDREDISPYVFETGLPKNCQIVCRRLVGEEEAKEFTQKIKDEYRVNMVLDNLPLVNPRTRWWADGDIFYQRGYHIGFMSQYAGSNDVKYFIHNHLSFLVKYERNPSSGASRIVGFEVKPFSVKHQIEGKCNGVNTRLSTWGPPHADDERELNSGPHQEIKVGEEIIFTYDVSFELSSTPKRGTVVRRTRLPLMSNVVVCQSHDDIADLLHHHFDSLLCSEVQPSRAFNLETLGLRHQDLQELEQPFTEDDKSSKR